MTLFFSKASIILFKTILFIEILFHPIHLSVCEVNYNQETKGVEIALKVFFDDLEEGVVKLGGPQLHLFTEKEHENADEWVFNYLKENLQIEVNNKNTTLEWVGKETNEQQDIQSLWIYMEVKNVRKIKELKITDTILFDVHEDQRNMLHLNCNGKKVSWLFDLKKISETITW